MQVLAGDIGGTSTRLWIAHSDGHTCSKRYERRFASRQYPGLIPILQEFLAAEAVGNVAAVCLAIAGPIRRTDDGEFCKVTNLPWEVDSRELMRALKLPRVHLINDFQAVGYGIEALRDDDVVVLQPGAPPPRAPRAALGAGTGLGQGILVWQGDHYEPIATEGGHAAFGPTDELQLALARYLLMTEGHSSCELILSGRGMVRLYEFLRAHGVASESPQVAQAIREGDAAAAITQAATESHDPLACQTLDLFVRIYGAQAGNLALTAGATGGVYIAGGIAPKILDKKRIGEFLGAFRDKANMAHYMESIPVHVVMNESVGLMGAALAAGRLSGQ
jgi:glucokinase